MTRDEITGILNRLQKIMDSLRESKDVSVAAVQRTRDTLQDAKTLLQDKLNETAARLAVMIDECQNTMGYSEFMTLLNAAKMLIAAALGEHAKEALRG